ncbi:Spc98 family-domain-containing protein [Mucor mucedo]|uniref:Spc98 family-domain-containing protein n=1 Tax=Mucor mucedo TaxID=29922 RepID=UPI00221FF2E6|nr:Spc98 family-domain-containing protein [Mucor mucedo]KAI7888030.1 Spc98 family-domain-containing protein [Mucor mucedo]
MQDPQGGDKAYKFGRLYTKLLSSNLDFQTRGLPNIDRETQYLLPPVSRNFDTAVQDDKSMSSRNTRRRLEREETPHHNEIDIDDLPPAIQLARARENERDETALIYVSESDLLRDLIYIFQGIDGQYIKYNGELNDYAFISDISVSKPMKDMVLKLADLGWLYIRIRNFIKLNIDNSSIGLVGQSLCAALQQELTEYYKLIAILEAQIEKQIANKSLPNDQTSLTLKRLTVWTLDYYQKLKLMSILVDVCQDQKGGALMTTIHNYTKHGDPFIKKYITEMLQVVSKPFYEMLERWVYEGELDDPYGEFFVACDPTVSEEDLWQSKYSIREHMLPSFLSKELGQRIFSLGKSLNFIRYSCHDDSLVEQYYTNTDNNTTARQTFKYGEIHVVEEAIDIAYLNTSTALLNLLKTKYKLMDHLKAMKRYLLLGQGDFIQYLMDILGDNLSKPATTLLRYNLTGILETAVRSSNAQYDDPEILNRLDVRLLEIQNDDLGWDVFTLDYHVDAPINTVFSSTAMHQYLQIFNFLWRLKRVEYTLSASWKKWGKASREFVGVPDIQQDLHIAQLTIQRMVHFIYQLQHYVLFEVLECSWDKLETFIGKKSIDLDSIIEAHLKYLTEISDKGFLSGPKEQTLSGRLNNIFDSILKYKVVLDYLHDYATSASAKSMYGNTANTSDRIDAIRLQHQEQGEDFTLQVLQFLDILKSYHDDDLRSLSTRLDYNGYYSYFNSES